MTEKREPYRTERPDELLELLVRFDLAMSKQRAAMEKSLMLLNSIQAEIAKRREAREDE